MRQRIRRQRRAFTLMEVLLVAGILALLAAFALPALMNQAKKAKIKLAEASVGRTGQIAKGLDFYRQDLGRYPETDEGLAALYKAKDDRGDDDRYDGPYMEGAFEELTDSWGNPFEYKCPGEFHENGYDLWSRGPDGVNDDGKEGSDDIKNW